MDDYLAALNVVLSRRIVNGNISADAGSRAARSPQFAHSDFELAKWIAIFAMVIDHYGKIVDPSIFLESHAIGRLAYPLFAGIIGIRMAFISPAALSRYRLRLLVWAIVSQPVFVIAGRPWYDGNIFFVLLLGVVASQLCERLRWQSVLGLIAVFACSCFLDYGPLGVGMIPLIAALTRVLGRRVVWMIGPLGVAANAVPTFPLLQWVDLTALTASLIMVVSAYWQLSLPRLPRLAFYVFYPAHLLLLHLIDLYR